MFAPTWRPWVFAWSSCSTCPSERGDGEAGDIARGEDVLATARAASVVDEDAVVDLEPCLLCEVGLRQDPEARDDDVGPDLAVLRRDDERPVVA